MAGAWSKYKKKREQGAGAGGMTSTSRWAVYKQSESYQASTVQREQIAQRQRERTALTANDLTQPQMGEAPLTAQQLVEQTRDRPEGFGQQRNRISTARSFGEIGADASATQIQRSYDWNRVQLDKAKSDLKQARKMVDGLSMYAGGFADGSLRDWEDRLADAQARVEQYSLAGTGLAGQYYLTENREQRDKLRADDELRGQYDAIRQMEQDVEAIRQVISHSVNYDGGPEATAKEAALAKKYGLTPGVSGYYGALGNLEKELEKRREAAIKALAEQGYDYKRMAGYEQMEQDKARYEGQQKEWAAYAREHPVQASARTLVTAPLQGIDYLQTVIGGLNHSSTKDLKNYVPANVYNMYATNFVQTVRGTVSEELEKNTDWELFGQNVASFLYNTGMSVGDSALQVATLGPAATYFMGSAAASGQAKDIIQRGGTTQQAFWGGLAAGAAEAVFEKFSVDRLLTLGDVGSFKALLKETAKQMGTEASEEMLTEVANILADAAIMGRGSQYHAAVREYQRQGLDQKEAERKAYLDGIGQVLWAGVGGALSGAAMGGPVSAANYVAQRGQTTDTPMTEPGSGETDTGAKTMPPTTAPVQEGRPQVTDGMDATPLPQPVKAQKNASTGEAEYRATKPQNVELPTVPMINLTTESLGANGMAGNSLRADAIKRARDRLGLNENPAAYIPASNVTRNGDEYILKITKASLNKMLSPAEGGTLPLESIVVMDNLERIANNGVWVEGQGDRKRRTQILGIDHLKTAVYIDGIPYEVDMRVRLVQEKPGAFQDNVLYYYTPEELVSIKKVDTGSPTGERRALTISSENRSTFYGPTLSQTPSGVNPQSAPMEGESIQSTEGTADGVHLHDGGQRADGADTGRPVPAVEREAGRDASGQGQPGPADGGTASFTYGAKVSPKGWGIPGGSAKKTLRVVTGGYNGATQRARELAEQHGLKPVLFSDGNLEIMDRTGKTIEARAYIEDGIAFVRVDHPTLTAEQLMRHEVGHDMIQKGEIDPETVRQRIENQLGREAVERVAALYAEAYAGSGLTAEEIWVEIICDSVGDINIFAGEQAEGAAAELLNETKKTAEIAQTEEARGPPAAGQFSREPNTAQAKITTEYERSVDKILNRKYTGAKTVLIGYTPDIYRKLGMPSLPFVIGSGHVYSAAKTEAEARSDGQYHAKTHYHGLGDATIKNILKAASDPVMIISAKDIAPKASPLRSTHSVVSIIDVGSGGKSLLLPIEITAERDVNGERMDVNVLSSAYERKVSGLVEEAIAQENTGEIGVYYAKKEAASLIGAGVQFPTRLQEAASSDGIVHRFGEKVNMNILEQTQTQQFKRWFGDWQNNPKNSSQVVNKDGTPMVVYYGAGSESHNFQLESGAYWFSENRDHAEKKTHERGGDQVVEVYLDIKKPYRATLPRGKWVDPGKEESLIRYAMEHGHDGVILKGPSDALGEADTSYVVFSPKQIKSATDNVGTFDRTNPDVRFSRETDTPTLTEEEHATVVATQEAVRAAVREELDRMGKEYGWIKTGETPARDIQMPKKTEKGKKLSQTVRTVLEARATPEAAIPTIEEMAAAGEFSYKAYSDKKAMADAKSKIKDNGFASALAEWSVEVGKGGVSKANTAMGWALYNAAANANDLKTAMTVLTSMVEHQRNAAQATQASRILKKMSPEAQLYGVVRSVENLQRELEERYKEKAPKLEIKKSLAEEFLVAKDGPAREAAMRALYQDIGKQMPSQFVDKWTAWRYLAMLGNPRTQVRNILGNAAFAPVVAAKNLTATAIEGAVYAVSGGKTGRTKALLSGSQTDRALLKAAWGDFAQVQQEISGGGKYNDMANANQYIEEGRVIFKTKWLEKYRKLTSGSMEKGDMWFSRPHYAAALAGYCKANGISAEQLASGEGLDEARAYAILEAQKATFRDTNALSEAISELGRYRGNNAVRKGISMAMEGILPFRKTPANILVRGLEYSPVGLLKGLTYDLYQVKQGNKMAAEAIESLAAGLTGTGLLALGMWAAAEGLVRGGGTDEEKERFEELMGHQTYSLELGDKSITLDWLAPECLPFFIGANLWEQGQASTNGLTMAGAITAVSNVTEPLLEMSCLQSLNAIFDVVAYASEGELSELPAVLVGAATSYLTQGLPSLLGQLERSGQENRMTTYTAENAWLTSDMQYALGQASGKLPGWDFQQIPYIDAWGRTESTGGVAERVGNNMLNPAYVSEVEISAMEEELMRLYDQTGKKSLFPARADKSFTVDGEEVELSAEQYVAYAKNKGQTSYSILSELTDSPAYEGLSDTEKAETVGLVYQYANALAKADVSGYQPDGWIAKAQDTIKATGISEAQYVLVYQGKKDITALKDADGESIPNSTGLQMMEMIYAVPGLTARQRKRLFEDFGVGKKIVEYSEAQVKAALKEMRGE